MVLLQNDKIECVYQARPDTETTVLEFSDASFEGTAMYYLRVREAEEYSGCLYSHSMADMA